MQFSDSEGEEEERDGRQLLIDYRSGWRAEEEVNALESRAQYHVAAKTSLSLLLCYRSSQM